MTTSFARREFLANCATQAALLGVVPVTVKSSVPRLNSLLAAHSTDQTGRLAAQVARVEPGQLQALALRAVDAARADGASYADARLTRELIHVYGIAGAGYFDSEVEEVGVGVRVLVNGSWGFAASPFWDPEAVVRLAHDAVAQATANAQGSHRTVDLVSAPVVTGTWATPIAIDPFAISIEEKLDHVLYWKDCAQNQGMEFYHDGHGQTMLFARQERVLATSDGSLTTQTIYESGGTMLFNEISTRGAPVPPALLPGLETAGKGWELFLDAKIPDQMDAMKQQWRENIALKKSARPIAIGRYTLVCDGATMASIVEQTFGVATQLDRALGYEANAGGTSFLDDPLAMVGHAQVAASGVTVTANRSAPAELATVQWDDEGVVPQPFTLITDGVLTDFQTTREQAKWLAPYYATTGQPVRSHGCAAAENAHYITMQQMPNMTLMPGTSDVSVGDMIADVTDGILLEFGSAGGVDFQAKNGLLTGRMRRITAGKLSHLMVGGTVLFNSKDLWKHVQAIGGPATQMIQGYSPQTGGRYRAGVIKGQPPQITSHSMQGVAAILPNQPIFDLRRKA